MRTRTPSRRGPLPLAALVATLFAPLAAHATNGYFSHGYGTKALGQAGVGIADSEDALAAATNPAGTLAATDRVDAGITLFAPRRGASITGNAFGADASYDGDGKKYFLVPELGVTARLSDTLAAGIALYGNGGMNTDYHVNPYSRYGATGHAGVNLEQLFVTPSIAWAPASGQRIGLGVNLAYQRFSAQGLGLFANFSSDPAHVTDEGDDSSTGAGVRAGWQGDLGAGFSAGVTWASRIHGRFDKYRGLFADGGRFDIPENFGLGVRYAPTADWSVGADVQRILYSQVAAVGDSIAPLLQGTPLGAAGGPGFGWRDVTAWKLAASFRASPALVLRGGFSYARQPVPADQTFFNILAPGVVQDHVTVGATWTFAGGSELSGYAARGWGPAVHGHGSIPPGTSEGGFGGGEANVHLTETLLGVAWAWKF